MKLVRFLLLVVVLVVTVLAVPEAYGAKRKGGTLVPQAKSADASAQTCYDIYCDSDDFPDDFCCNTLERCLGYCDGVCGGGPGSCEPVY
jgi:hypothetical protein